MRTSRNSGRALDTIGIAQFAVRRFVICVISISFGIVAIVRLPDFVQKLQTRYNLLRYGIRTEAEVFDSSVLIGYDLFKDNFDFAFMADGFKRPKFEEELKIAREMKIPIGDKSSKYYWFLPPENFVRSVASRDALGFPVVPGDKVVVYYDPINPESHIVVDEADSAFMRVVRGRIPDAFGLISLAVSWPFVVWVSVRQVLQLYLSDKVRR